MPWACKFPTWKYSWLAFFIDDVFLLHKLCSARCSSRCKRIRITKGINVRDGIVKFICR
ncbi:hypothetical protein ACHAXS_000390 [Conticribra weissflogii]